MLLGGGINKLSLFFLSDIPRRGPVLVSGLGPVYRDAAPGHDKGEGVMVIKQDLLGLHIVGHVPVAVHAAPLVPGAFLKKRKKS